MDDLYRREGLVCHVATEIEGFLFQGQRAEQRYRETDRFEFITTSGYYHSLPGDALHLFIDASAEVQCAMGFANEKDHPEVAPSQFEMNYSRTEAPIAADQVLIYKLVCRQVAHKVGMTASFLPKPVTGVNGSGMHTNLSIARGDTNLFYDSAGRDGISSFGWSFINRILHHAKDLCLILNSSVNAYRRLDPHYEAPKKIKASPVDRGAMIRIPIGNACSARIEVRSIAPDANPYLAICSLLRTGLKGTEVPTIDPYQPLGILPDNIYDALDHFRASTWVEEIIGEDVAMRFAATKQASANRCPRLLGTIIKHAEIQFHHEVTNQHLWNFF